MSTCFCLFVHLMKHSIKIFISPPKGECSLSNFNCLKNSQILDLRSQIMELNVMWCFNLVWLEAPDKVVGGSWQFSNQFVYLTGKFVQNSRSFLRCPLVLKQFNVNIFDIWTYFIHIFEFKAINIIGNFARRMVDFE